MITKKNLHSWLVGNYMLAINPKMDFDTQKAKQAALIADDVMKFLIEQKLLPENILEK